jgi:hypothetical protein
LLQWRPHLRLALIVLIVLAIALFFGWFGNAADFLEW